MSHLQLKMTSVTSHQKGNVPQVVIAYLTMEKCAASDSSALVYCLKIKEKGVK